MQHKARRILQGKQGLSMILVLCIGALFTALSAALVYAASVLTANANRQLLEQEVYQLAASFSDVLEQQLNDSDSSFANFINTVYMTSEGYGRRIYEEESPETVFDWNRGSTAPADGADAIRVTLRRRPGDGVDKLTQVVENYETAAGLLEQLESWEGGDDRQGMEIVDLQLDVTVTVEKDGETFSYTRTYDRTVQYDSDGSKADKNIFPQVYYTVNDGTTKYYRLSGLTFYAAGAGQFTISDATVKNYRLTYHCETRQIPSHITYTRGVKQDVGTTQE